jgi:hypothetical protein
MATVAEFLVRVAENAELAEELRRYPQEVVAREEYGLSRDQQQVILEGDLTKLRETLDTEFEKGLVPPELGKLQAVYMIIIYGPFPPIIY